MASRRGLASGPLGIPYPVGSDPVVPTAALLPMNGWDEAGYRLGYGGGFFDRTLASLTKRRLLRPSTARTARRSRPHFPEHSPTDRERLVTIERAEGDQLVQHRPSPRRPQRAASQNSSGICEASLEYTTLVEGRGQQLAQHRRDLGGEMRDGQPHIGVDVGIDGRQVSELADVG
jgi:hypothetical protein